MSPDYKREQYPYSKNRVYLSGIIAVLSIALAFTLLSSNLLLMLCYFLATSALTFIIYHMKKRLYPRIITEEDQAEDESQLKLTSSKMMLIIFLMLIGFISIPLLLAGFIGGAAWFIMITSFTSGVSISEVLLFIRSSSYH